jgi:hypothetical protein
MRVRRLVEIISVTVLIVAVITIKDLKVGESFSLTKTTVSKISVPFTLKGIK